MLRENQSSFVKFIKKNSKIINSKATKKFSRPIFFFIHMHMHICSHDSCWNSFNRKYQIWQVRQQFMTFIPLPNKVKKTMELLIRDNIWEISPRAENDPIKFVFFCFTAYFFSLSFYCGNCSNFFYITW